MKISFSIFLTMTAILSSTPSSHAHVPDVANWKAGVAAIHGKVKDQGDVGFCWANAWASFLESKVLIEKNRTIEISPMYVGRAHMANDYVSILKAMNVGPVKAVPTNKDILTQSDLTILSRYQYLKNDPIGLEVTKEFFTRKLQSLSEDSEGSTFSWAFGLGIVPTSAYEKETFDSSPIGPIAESLPPFVNKYHSPRNEIKFKNFINKHLLNSEDMKKYLSEGGTSLLERDFDLDVGNTPISERDTFIFEGSEYTPRSFLRDYIGFSPSIIKLKPIQFQMPVPYLPGLMRQPTQPAPVKEPVERTGTAMASNFHDVVTAIQGELELRHPVLLSALLFDDIENDSSPGDVMDQAYCKTPGKCTVLGGHAVMIVNSMKDKTGKVKAFIIQNSWGPQGTDENGNQTKVRADRGFNIITIDYLQAAIEARGFAFGYMMF